MVFQNGTKGYGTRYLVEEVRYERDPSDMWWITASFAPRQEK